MVEIHADTDMDVMHVFVGPGVSNQLPKDSKHHDIMIC